MRFISICSGIEAASVAFGPLGWKAVAFSEIEPFPCAVLAHHYPDVPNFGDMTKFREWPEEIFANADAIVGGPPCQAFSVAGLRNGLNDDRGNLTLTYAELINYADAIRLAHGKPPVVVLYENVPGLLSDKTGAFGCFLGALAGEDGEIVPPGGKWTNAGCVSGPQRALAWAVTDAQFFGMAQRRRRVFVVASARDGFDPAAILFEPESVRRDTPPSREAGEGFTHATAPCLTSSGRGVERTGDTRGQDPVVGCWWDGGQVSQTLDAVLSKGQTMPEKNRFPAVLQPTVAFPANLSGTQCASTENLSPSLGAKNPTAVAFAQNQLGEVRSGEVFNTLNTNSNASGRNTPMVAQPVAQPVAFQSSQSGIRLSDTHATLDANNGPRRHNGVMTTVATFQQSSMKGKGTIGYDESGVAKPVKTQSDGQMVAFTVGNLARGAGPSPSSETFPTLTVSKGCGISDQQPSVMTSSFAVRRLTPTECERLQGFPDNWTLIPWRKKPAEECPDGPRYKALGNSWAVPNVRWIGARIQAEISK